MVSLFLVVSMIISVPVCALEPVEEKTITPTTPIGYLVSDDGVVYEIEGKLVNAPCAVMSNESNEGIPQTYMYDLSSLSHRAGGSNTVHDTDKMLVSTVYLTINYSYYTDSVKGDMYLLTSVSGYWVVDDHQVFTPSASLYYGCSDPGITQSTYVFPISVNNHFSVDTDFTTYVRQEYGVMGANLTVNYQMGSSRKWSFSLPNTLFNNIGHL